VEKICILLYFVGIEKSVRLCVTAANRYSNITIVYNTRALSTSPPARELADIDEHRDEQYNNN